MPLRQWTLKITAYADALLSGLDGLDWPSGTITMQREWIGRSEGTRVVFSGPDPDGGADIAVFTTRADTVLGATYVVLAPEHPLVGRLTSPSRAADIEAYLKTSARRSDLERTASKSKTGVFTGGSVTNPLTGEALPVWVGDYVLGSYGTGAVMAVPAHDQRDFDFAKAHGLEIREVVEPESERKCEKEEKEGAFTDLGVVTSEGGGAEWR